MEVKSKVSDAWNDFKSKANIGDTLDYIAVLSILRSCVNGVSIRKIAEIEDLPVDYVNDVILEFLGHAGFEKDLDKSPIKLYNISTSLVYTTFDDAGQYITEMCKKFLDIERKVNEYYSS